MIAMALVSRWILVITTCLHAMSTQVSTINLQNLHPRWTTILNSDFEIVIPYHADKEGGFKSHDLITAHREHHRRRRDAAQPNHSAPPRHNDTRQHAADHLHINIHSHHSQYPLQLSPSYQFLSPQFKIHRRFTRLHENGTQTRETNVEVADIDVTCFYRGDSRGDRGVASLSVCDGLMGYIRTGDQHYIIEPLPGDMLVSSLPQELYNQTRTPAPHTPATRNHTGTPHPAASHATHNYTHSNYSRKIYRKLTELHNKYPYHPNRPGENQNTKDAGLIMHHIMYKYHWSPDTSLTSMRANNISKGLLDNSCMQGREHQPSDAYGPDSTSSINVSSSQHSRIFSTSAHDEISTYHQTLSPTEHMHSDATQKRTRNRRSVSYDPALGNEWANVSHSVETIVVVDSAMIRNHGEQNVTVYALTLLNMMNNLYHDNTIGTKINFTILALILLEGDEVGLDVNEKADQTLNNFCHWQSNLKGLHHDHAILLTGVDICSFNGQYCDTLGFAPIEGMCKRFLSCTINEDNGLGTAFTITHEAGHNFGMRHDGDDNHCLDLAGSIMAPRIQGNKGVFKWSACSRRYLDKFLSSQQAWCLEDEPRQLTQLRFPDKLPGELYDADIQCKWQFGPKSRLCTYDFADDLCASLWCHTGGQRCETKFLPAAEGTSCGYQRWCRKGMCVEYGDEGPGPVDGVWSGWSPWTTCTRSCAGGVMFRHRACNRPKPQYGGADCEGEQRMYKMCNLQACPGGQVDLRAEQCSVYDGKPFRGHMYTWLPYTNIYEEEEQCKLYCKDADRKIYFEMNHRVEDGTPCILSPHGVCVDGECQSIGCDNVVGSVAKLDQCGVCGGDNSTCQVIQGTISSYFSPNYYHYVMRIPEHARSIAIAELARSPSYLALRSTNGIYFLNGNWRVSWPGRKTFAGCAVEYQRPFDGPERISTAGPLNQPLIVEILALRETPTIVYSYTIPRVEETTTDPPPPKHNYTWSVSESQCSVSCASGEKIKSAKCLRDHFDEVEESYCDKPSKPYTGLVSCNDEPCPPEWITSDWANCSKPCGGGIQKRKVACMQIKSANHTVKVRSHTCHGLPKPRRRRRCHTHECPPQWHTGPWTACSLSCGVGTRRRQVVCRNRQHKLQHHYCEASPKPEHVQKCEATPCHTQIQWYLSQWTECSTTCGEGIRTRILRCSGENLEGKFEILPGEQCRHLDQPMVPLQEMCNEQVCLVTKQPKWFVSPWSQCSVTCGEGTQIRLIRCLDGLSARRTDGCDESDKPETTQACDTQISCTASVVDSCRDDWHMCNLVPKNNLCHHHYYGKQCCASCQGRTSAARGNQRVVRHG